MHSHTLNYGREFGIGYGGYTKCLSHADRSWWISKKQTISVLSIRKDLALWEASVTEKYPQTVSARMSNPMSGGQC